MYVAWAQSQIEGCWVPHVHANCSHNEISALLQRTLGPTPEPADGGRGLDASFKRLRRVAARYGGSRWDYLTTAETYTGALRRKYLEAERSLMLDGPLSSSDVMLRAFLKAEKRAPSIVAKPRMIFPRSARYNLVLASWLKPFEHWLWGNLKSLGNSGVKKTRVVAKGLNPRQRANLIRRKFRQVPDCVVFEVDGKAFEAHVDVFQLRREHEIYAAAYPGDGGLRRVLNKQLGNFGVTANGVRFGRSGGRASGDFNTGMGNSLIMLAVVDSVMRLTGARCYDTLVDGDNALLFVSRRDLSRVVEQFGPLALELSGHEMVLERPVDFLEGVRFGQSAPVEVASGWTMVRDWRKVLSNGSASHAHLQEPGFLKEFLQGVALCELSLARGVPVIGAWAESLRRCTEQGPSVRLHLHRDYEVLGVDLSRVMGAQYVEPTVRARESFARAFDVPPELQLAIESWLARGTSFVDWWLPQEPSLEFPSPDQVG